MAAPMTATKMSKTLKNKGDNKPVFVAKSTVDFQRIKLERLMKNPEKPVAIPEAPRDKVVAAPPEFNRNVMGSSAGAGSGEFHVYRHIRRREYARQKYINERADKEDKDVEFHRKIEENRELAEQRTAKKRSKRMKKKLKSKLLKKTGSKSTGKPDIITSSARVQTAAEGSKESSGTQSEDYSSDDDEKREEQN